MKKILVISDDGFTSLNGGGILKRNLFSGYDKNTILSLDCQENQLLESDINRISLSPYILQYKGIKLINWFRLQLSNSHQKLDNKGGGVKLISKVLIGDSSKPSHPIKLRKLKKKVEVFKPDVIYTTFGSYAINKITLYLSKEFEIPIISHVMDDWIEAKNNYGLLSLLHKRAIDKVFSDIIRISSIRYVISDGMKLAYEKRYGYEFSTLNNTVEPDRIKKGKLKSKNSLMLIGYVGSFSENSQRMVIDDIVKSIEKINSMQLEFQVVLRLFITEYDFPYAKNCYKNGNSVSVELAPSDDDEFYNLMESFDLLLLPSSFDGVANKYIKFSIPAKFFSYLASGVPVLFYGDSRSEQIRLATQYKLGIIVQNKSISEIVNAIKYMFLDDEKIKRVLDRQFNFISRYCNAEKDRGKFYYSIENCWLNNFYSINSNYHDNLVSKKRFYLQQIIDKFRPKSIIDFGCGTGITLSKFIHKKYPEIKLTLFDTDESSLKAAAWAGDSVEKISNINEVLNQKYDLVIISEVIEHISQQDNIQETIFSILKDEGVVYITVPNGYGAYELTAFAWRLLNMSRLVFSNKGKNIKTNVDNCDLDTLSSSPHISFYTYTSFIKSFNSAGFVVKHYFPIMLSHINIMRWMSSTFPYVAKMNFEKCLYFHYKVNDDWGFVMSKNTIKSPNVNAFQANSLFNKIRIYLYTRGITLKR